ncbi:MAG: cytochrome c oxidase assembly protein [Trebonia sp.]|jgi:cytochrome c oxidase assembly factor CtaG
MAPLATAYSALPKYSGPPKLTLVRAFTEWRVDVPMLVLILVIGGWYVLSTRQVRRQGGQWGIGRTIAFIGLGLGFWVIATMSWVGVYQSALFYARATQTVLLVLVAPLFLMMGKPVSLLIEAQPAVGGRVAAAIRSPVAKIVTFPAITTLLLIAVPMTMYFTSWYTAVFNSGTVRELTYLILMVPGCVFFWTLLRVDPVPKRYPYGVAMWITAAEVVGDAFFGIAIIADTNLIAAPHYHAVGYPFGPSLATSQVLGGGIIWILGDAVGLPFLAVQLIQMMREDKAEAAAIDAELDARDAERDAARKAARAKQPAAAVADPGSAPAAAPGPAATAAAQDSALAESDTVPAEADDAGDDERPWWETDPRLLDRFKNA